MKNLLQSVKDWFRKINTTYDWELERYLAQSTDAADLEYRMRKWEQNRMHRNSLFIN
jgi:hypothetical protein